MQNIKNVILFTLFICFFSKTYTQDSNQKPIEDQELKNVENLFEDKNYEDVEQFFKERDYDKVINILGKKEVDSKLSMREYYLLARSYARIGQYSNGYTLAIQMYEKSSAKKDTANLVIAYNLRVENLTDMSKVKEGVRLCDEAGTVFRVQDSIELQKLCFKCGVLYYYDKDYDKAYDTYNKITKKEYRKLPVFTGNYGLVLMGLKKWDEAIVNFKNALKYKYESKDVKEINITLSNIGLAYIKQKKWKEAKVFLDSAHRSFTLESQIRGHKTLNENYFLLYKGQKKIDTALEYLERINDWNEEIFREKINEKIYSLENSNKREHILKKKVKVIDDELITSQKQKLWGAVILLFIILVLLSIVFIFAYNRIRTAHENILTEQKLLRSQMTPHFIFNSLSVLQGMILNNEEKKAVLYLSKFSKLLRLILESSREKLVYIQEELEALQNYMDLQNMGSKNSFKYTLQLDDNIQEIGLLIPPMLIQPFVENAIIHGFKNNVEDPEISIEISFKENKLVCLIKDNGVGIDNGEKIPLSDKKSLATKITSERLKIISKKFKVPSGVFIQNRSVFNEKGTQVTLTLPYKIDQND
ncbi:tetratricopeptide repeat-containing sensor histidine kinase [Aquimarina algiphila]|uniref:tetratricopeptide repeat-containing sensor histidine kinase n=1 Tax=Aquimarina algiphila TaxID=2047982 RepID=UPI0024932A11|nr:histidine kinase [Aquimarina algiphila]